MKLLTSRILTYFYFLQIDDHELDARKSLIRDIETVLDDEMPDSTIVLFGSFPVGLSTFLSDLDVSICAEDVETRRAQVMHLEQLYFSIKVFSYSTAISLLILTFFFFFLFVCLF